MDRLKEISYQTQNRAYKKVFAKVGVLSSSTTHTNRGTAARECDTSGVPENQLKRIGRWESETMVVSYLTSLPDKAMRSLAGFLPDSSGTYYLKRANVEPPEELKRLIFPDVEKWQAAFKEGKVQRDVAGPNFLELLVNLRTVLLQVKKLRLIDPYFSIGCGCPKSER